MDLKELKDLHEQSFIANQRNRELATDDTFFYLISQWDDALGKDMGIAYRGEFNILKKAGRQILSDLASNPIQIDFNPKDQNRDDAAEILDGLYRINTNTNTSIEAFENAKQEAVICGVGAWRLENKLMTDKVGEDIQYIKRTPIYEANSNILWDPNSKYLDKSDALYVSVLNPFSESGYRKLVSEITGVKEEEVKLETFDHPEQTYTFSWLTGENPIIYVAEFYLRKKEKETLYDILDPMDQLITLSETQIKDIKDELKDSGFEIKKTYEVKKWKIHKYLASGIEILEETVIPGEHIPIVPCYGEHAFVDGSEHYEGLTRQAKDPQRLRNFQFSYLADIVSKSPRKKPIFTSDQIAGFEHYYTQAGPDDNYPYALIKTKSDASGAPLDPVPVGYIEPTEMPQALAVAIELTRQAVEDVATPGLPQDIADPEISGKAVLALQSRLDMQSMIYQEHYKHAKRRDGEIYASMAAEIFDVPRRALIERPDGTKKYIEIMQAVIDRDTGKPVFLNDLRNIEFEVYSKIGASYSSQKEQTLDRIEKMMMTMDANDPLRKILQLKYLTLTDGVEMDDIREYANKQLVIMGAKKPDTEQEIEILKASQENAQKNDAAMVMAQAEQLKGQADMLEQNRKGIEMQLKHENDQIDHSIDAFKAETERMGLMLEAEKTGVSIDKTRLETEGTFLDNRLKLKELRLPIKNKEKM